MVIKGLFVAFACFITTPSWRTTSGVHNINVEFSYRTEISLFTFMCIRTGFFTIDWHVNMVRPHDLILAPCSTVRCYHRYAASICDSLQYLHNPLSTPPVSKEGSTCKITELGSRRCDFFEIYHIGNDALQSSQIYYI